MNKEDIENVRKRIEEEDEQKLVDAINEQYRKENDKYRIRKMYLRLKNQKKRNREKLFRKIERVVFTAAMILIFALLLFLSAKESETFMNDCMSSGHSENFCERGR